MRTRIEKLITDLTVQTFKTEEGYPDKALRKQISLRPNLITLVQIDTLADILDQSRQMLMDELLESALMDAVDAYADAHGPKHSEEARQGFVVAFKKRWDEYSSGDQS